jgi:hypothetical protein
VRTIGIRQRRRATALHAFSKKMDPRVEPRVPSANWILEALV